MFTGFNYISGLIEAIAELIENEDWFSAEDAMNQLFGAVMMYHHMTNDDSFDEVLNMVEDEMSEF